MLDSAAWSAGSSFSPTTTLSPGGQWGTFEIAFHDLLSVSDYRLFFQSFIKGTVLNIVLSFVFILITALIVSRGITRGIEAANRFMMPAFLLMLIGLILYSLTLPNAAAGIRFYLVPDLTAITAQTIFDALRLAFFTLSLGIGGLITYGSYVKKSENLVQSAAIVTWADTIVAFLA
ncbi:MAG TPA: hypothetical protein VD816_00440, partial [Ohtaekwangia sp.]|nr:hypothetical protein [Ohtaekwangia sp.]